MPNSYFDALMQSSEDALQNHAIFSLIVPSLPIANFPVENLNLRVTNCTAPEFTIDVYEVIKRGKKFERPSGVSGMTKEFSFTYRIDRYYTTYNALIAWMGYIHNPVTNTMASDAGLNGTGGLSTFRAPINITAIDTNDNLLNTWTYMGCFPKTHDAIEFDETSGEPITASCTMSYVDIFYPSIAEK